MVRGSIVRTVNQILGVRIYWLHISRMTVCKRCTDSFVTLVTKVFTRKMRSGSITSECISISTCISAQNATKAFFYKSRKSSHKKGGGCPNADGENQYPTRAVIDPALAATFKRKRQMPVTFTEGNPTPEPPPQQPALPIPPEPLAGTSEHGQPLITGEPVIQNPEQEPMLGEPILGGEPGQILENLRRDLGLTEEGTDPSLLPQQGADALMIEMSQGTLIESATGDIVKPEPVGEEGERENVTEPIIMLDLNLDE